MTCKRMKMALYYAASMFVALQCLSIPAVSNGSTCPRQFSQVEKGRKCRKSCQVKSDCKGRRKSCLCDDVCGLSCYNPNSRCPDLQPPKNGFLSVSGTTVGKTVKYICMEGYTLLGSRVRKCRSDRKWSGKDSVCEDLSRCGVRGDVNIQRVVGGSDASEGSWPWQVVILKKNNVLRKSDIFAGGTIIHRKWVLTAAHMVLKFDGILRDIIWKTKFTMIAGISEFPDENEKVPDEAVFIEPNRVIIHEEFNPRTNNFDIALIEIGEISKGMQIKKSNSHHGGFASIPFSTRVRPICLPCNSNTPIHEPFSNCFELQKNQSSNAVVTGFGTTNSKTIEYPKNLQEGQLTIMHQSSCYDVLRTLSSRAAKIPSGLLCAKGIRPGTDACYGDSGGPLVQQVRVNEFEVRWVQTGIVSFGFDCGGNYPGYYTATSQFIAWIQKHMHESDLNQQQSFPNNTKPSKPAGQQRCDRVTLLSNDRAVPWRVTILKKVVKGAQVSSDDYVTAAYGIILNAKWTVTVAHPFVYAPCSGCIVLKFGENDKSKLYWISGITFHPKFDRRTLRYNVILMKVGSSFRFNRRGWIYDRSVPSGKITPDDYIQPVCKGCLSRDEVLLDTYTSCNTQESTLPVTKSIHNSRAIRDDARKQPSYSRAFSIFKCGEVSKSTFCARGPTCNVVPGQSIVTEEWDESNSRIIVVGMISKQIRCQRDAAGIYAFTAFTEIRDLLAKFN